MKIGFARIFITITIIVSSCMLLASDSHEIDFRLNDGQILQRCLVLNTSVDSLIVRTNGTDITISAELVSGIRQSDPPKTTPLLVGTLLGGMVGLALSTAYIDSEADDAETGEEAFGVVLISGPSMLIGTIGGALIGGIIVSLKNKSANHTFTDISGLTNPNKIHAIINMSN